jgi:aminobenzoyl-glutamate transport protein
MSKKEKKRGIGRFLHYIEVGGNALPHPASLFGILALLVILLSWIGYIANWEVIHPATGETIRTVNLMSKEGFHRIFLEMVTNYTGFAPLGIVMVALLGISVMESSGLVSGAIRLLILKSPPKIITFVVVFAGVLSNMASDLGYVLVIPLAGVIFHSLGRHPIVGMAAAFAGVSGGFSANLLIGTIDPLLAGLSTEAANILDPDYEVLPTANWYFMIGSTFMITGVGTWVTNKFVEPQLGTYTGDVPPEPLDRLTKQEKKGIKRVMLAIVIIVGLLVAGLLPDNGFLRLEDNTILGSLLLKGFITFLFIIAAILGLIYGVTTGKFKNDTDVIKGMETSFKTMAAYLVLVFFAAQFVAYFRWTNLGLIIAIKGAEFLQNSNMGLIPIVILFTLLAGFINLFMGSASAKWAILGPVFIPMFMLLGYSPELSQAIYRVGDSVTNIISPMMSFFALILVWFEKYDKKSGIGTLISTMLPYSFTFFIAWTVLLIAWILLNIPLGPGSEIYYEGVVNAIP